MTSARQPSFLAQADVPGRVLFAGLVFLAVTSFLLLFHNYGYPILPRKQFTILPAQLTPHSAAHPHVYVFAFDHSEPNRYGIARSAAILLENGVPYGNAMSEPQRLMEIGGRRWVHEPGRILFATEVNGDPRVNGCTYTVSSPILYTRRIGLGAAAVFVLSVAGLGLCWRRQPAPPAAPAPSKSRWPWHVGLASGLFLLGLYCNTGTLPPYAITTFPHRADETGYLYNPDHVHFRALSDFVQGEPRARWDGALLLRRILFPVMAWPFVKLAGFEIGGTLASLTFNVLALVACAYLLRRWIGERGAIFALWLLALYPGFAYWGGLPYPYALITPLCLLMVIALHHLATATGRRFAAIALAMGIASLAYDFTALFVPATLLLLCWHRRPLAAGLAAGVQLLPLAIWVLLLARVFHQPLANSNTGTYGVILAAYGQPPDWAHYGTQLAALPETFLEVFFGANFLFLPGFFLLLLALNPWTSRVRLVRAEVCLLLVALGIFLFNHFAPFYSGWQMRGAWISRLYQPILPALVFFAARWWQHLPPLRWPARLLVTGALAGVMVGNALVVFGPILNNPLRVSEAAFYRFFNHNDEHWVYEGFNLKRNGRHPLGFAAPPP